jgi:methylthioribose-1-phosphate isomerase
MKFSPLFWPIQLKGNTLYILDETALPHKLTYIKVKTYQEAAKAIKEMKTRAFGQVLLVFSTFLLVLKKNKNKKNILPLLEKVAATLNTTRPTLPFKFLTDMVLGWARVGEVERKINGFLEVLKEKRIQRAQEVTEIIQDKDVILTHCNVSGELPLIAEFCRKQGKYIEFFVTETRPYLQGSRLTAWELHLAGFPVTVMTDGMVASIMSQGKITKVIVGADQLAQNGDIANKIGTYQIALVAKHFEIPFYVLCPPPSNARTGKDIKVEIRPDKELLEYQGIRLAPYGVKGFYPAFDITPSHLITKHFHLGIAR